MASICVKSQEKRNLKQVLVTGAAGFIGSAFVRYILSQSDFKGSLICLDALTYAGNLDNLKPIENDPRYVFQKGDIRDQCLVEKLCQEHSVDTIIHFAAESHVDRSITGPLAFIETNILGTFHLLEVVKKNPHIHFHHVSTDEVYGCLGLEGVFTEETCYRPNSPYSASKASSDHLVRSYGKTYKLSTCISNCSNNYGPYQFPEKLIPLMILNAFNKRPLPVYGEGLNVRDWLYVDDHVECLWQLLHKGETGETYNIGGEQEMSNIDLIRKILAIIAKFTQVPMHELESLITYVKDRPGHDFRYAIDCSKVKKHLGWSPSPSLDTKLEETVIWYVKNSVWVERVLSGEYRDWIKMQYA